MTNTFLLFQSIELLKEEISIERYFVSEWVSLIPYEMDMTQDTQLSAFNYRSASLLNG